MTSEIMPCPFCGGDAGFGRVGRRLEIICNRCGSAGALKADRDDARDAWNTRARAARPAPEAGSVVERVGYMIENPSAWDTFDQKASDLLAECTAALAEANEKTERLERERDGALKAHDIIVGSALKWRDRLLVSEAHASELRRDVERKDAALVWYENNVAGCRLIHSGGDAHRAALAEDGGTRARAALQQEGENDAAP